jgi:hypothetical protein
MSEAKNKQINSNSDEKGSGQQRGLVGRKLWLMQERLHPRARTLLVRIHSHLLPNVITTSHSLVHADISRFVAERVERRQLLSFPAGQQPGSLLRVWAEIHTEYESCQTLLVRSERCGSIILSGRKTLFPWPVKPWLRRMSPSR